MGGMPINTVSFNSSNKVRINSSNPSVEKTRFLGAQINDSVSFGSVSKDQAQEVFRFVDGVFADFSKGNHLTKNAKLDAYNKTIETARIWLKEKFSLIEEMEFPKNMPNVARPKATDVFSNADEQIIVFDQFKGDDWLSTLSIDSKTKAFVVTVNDNSGNPFVKTTTL